MWEQKWNDEVVETAISGQCIQKSLLVLIGVTQANFLKTLAVGGNLVSVVLPRPSWTNKLTILISED